SKRLHTRSTRDWSSDMCSSDLELDVAELHVHGDQRAAARIGGHERRRRASLLEVPQDGRRLVEDEAVLLERRHAAVGVEPEVVRAPVRALRHVELDELDLEPLLQARDAHAARVGRERMVVELQHVRITFPTFCRSWMKRWAAAASTSGNV